MHHDSMRYTLQIDMLERDETLGDQAARRLLAADFALAVNASYLQALSADDLAVGVHSRTFPQEGVARYRVTLELVERTPAMTDEQAAELVRRELQRAQNASHFLRVCGEDFRVALVARERVVVRAAA